MSKVGHDERMSAQIAEQAGVAAGTGVGFVATASALVHDYGDAQVLSLKAGLLVTALLVLGPQAFTRDLPRTPPSVR